MSVDHDKHDMRPPTCGMGIRSDLKPPPGTEELGGALFPEWMESHGCVKENMAGENEDLDFAELTLKSEHPGSGYNTLHPT